MCQLRARKPDEIGAVHMQLVLAPVMSQAGHSAYLTTADGSPVSIHALVEVLHRNLHTIRHITNSSTQQQLYEAAVLLPLQHEPQPRKEEAEIVKQVLHQRCSWSMVLAHPVMQATVATAMCCQEVRLTNGKCSKVVAGSRVCHDTHQDDDMTRAAYIVCCRSFRTCSR